MIFLKSKNNILYIVLIITASSCIDNYTPELSAADTNKLVVNGSVTDETGYQYVYISKSSSIASPDYIPVSGCDVKIMDDKGHMFQLSEDSKGKYTGYIDQEYLTEGSAFKVDILTPDGNLVSSEYDTLYSCPEIDSVYYNREDILTTDPEQNIEGIQFYIDYNGAHTDTKYLKWDLYETWEYHAKYPKQWYIDKGTGVIEIDPPDYSLNVCWQTEKINQIFNLSTKNLTGNKFTKFPLHYVDNTTQRLAHGYSLLVKQCSLSKQAYEYYEKIQLVINKEGGLYYTQPFAVEGNLMNITNTNEIVLGIFHAGSITTKRIFVKPMENLPLKFNYLCNSISLEKVGFQAIRDGDYPAFLWPGVFWIWLKENCYNCQCAGGNINKPAFWEI